MKQPRILFYDIETTPLRAYIWRLGDQVIRHQNLDTAYNTTQIICIGYAWNDGKPAKCIHWGYNEQDSENVIKRFDRIISQADITIGKNSDRFDVKHINTQRLLHKLPPLPQWVEYTDDLEKQIRKYFAFPSNSLDYVSKLLGYGGKRNMSFQDWINIVEKRSRNSLRKMVTYCKKDVEDTRAVWNDISAYVKPKFNMSTFYGEPRCVHCGSSRIRKDGTRIKGISRYQEWECKDGRDAGTHSYAGKTLIPKPGSDTLLRQ